MSASNSGLSDGMIPRVAFVMVLGALAGALVVAAAAEGRLDRLPPQPYFPAALSKVHHIDCDPEGALWPEQISDTRWDAPVVDKFEADWFGTHLRAAQELSLSRPPTGEGPSPARSLRFTWLRSFHAPVIIRVDETPAGAMQLTGKLLSGYGGYGPGGISRRLTRTLTREEAAVLDRLRVEALDRSPVGCGAGADGARWIVEARDGAGYRLVQRWSPVSGPVHDLGMLLVGYTGWKVEPVY
jgi:hypothetical protein